jgi:hypothetical protein
MQTQSVVSSIHDKVKVTIDLSLDRNGSPLFAISADRKMPIDILKATLRGALVALESSKTKIATITV